MEFFKIPEPLKREHEELHEELVKATKESGPIGKAARVIIKLMHPHFAKEEDFALPPLGLLSLLIAGKVSPVMLGVTEMTDRLKADLHKMLDEHESIVAAAKNLAAAARRGKKLNYVRFADKLIQHASMEEEVLYPAAILIGEFIKVKLKSESVSARPSRADLRGGSHAQGL
jgi:hypothetical protein